jgi:hypothetical protein
MKEMDEQRAYTINMLGESLEKAKSEVEMLQGALKAEERHNELTMEMAQKALKNAKAEVAGEIFEEIERIANEEYEFYSEQYRKCTDTDGQEHLDGELTGIELLHEKITKFKEKYIKREIDNEQL